jgi:tetratricopeptide (TPR) repeat protein
LKPIYEQHIDLFQQHAVLLCGAGISVNSGIPSVVPFTKHLLKKLGADVDHIETFVNSGFPFEAMMEVLKARLDIFKLLGLFDVINPNDNHSLIAWLAKSGWLKLIITTNFDRNIETALKDLGLQKDIDFTVIIDLDHVVADDFKDKLVVLKLHGSIENHPSILSTITGVANKVNQVRMVKVFNFLFAPSDYEHFITWGYSFSDHFDIKPALRQIAPSGKHIYSIRYQSRKKKEFSTDNSANPLFSQFLSATDWHCSLDQVVAAMAKAVGSTQSKVIKAGWLKKMNQILKQEINGTGLHSRNGTLAALFQTAGHTNIALQYATAGLNKLGNRQKDQLLKMDLTASIGKAYIRDPNNRDPPVALKYMEEALGIASNLKLTDYVRIYSADIASCYLMLEWFAKAESPYIEVIKHYKPLLADTVERAGAIDKIYGYQIMLAHCYAKQDKFVEALALYDEIFKGCIAEGLLSNQELCMAGYGLVYTYKKEAEKGLPFFVEGYALAVLNGSADRIKSQFYLVCSWTWAVKGKPEATIFYNQEYSFVNKKTGMNKSLDEIGPGLTGSLK